MYRYPCNSHSTLIFYTNDRRFSLLGVAFVSVRSFLNNEFGTPPETVEIEEHHAHYVPPTILPEVEGSKGAILGEKDERKEMMEVYCRLKREGREGKRRLQIEERGESQNMQSGCNRLSVPSPTANSSLRAPRLASFVRSQQL